MARKTVAATLALMAVSLSGCGTFNDAICGPPHSVPLYNCVQFDVEMALQGGDGLPRPLGLLALADIPLSAAADTVLVPIIGGGLLVALAWKVFDPEFKTMQLSISSMSMPEGRRDSELDEEISNNEFRGLIVNHASAIPDAIETRR
jgi:uncharacterized protein YceK